MVVSLNQTPFFFLHKINGSSLLVSLTSMGKKLKKIKIKIKKLKKKKKMKKKEEKIEKLQSGLCTASEHK